MTTHAKFSPSSAHRWIKCPGSAREEANYPDVSGNAAIDGTHSHTLLEHCIKGGLGNPVDMIGVVMKDDYGTFTVDEDRANRVKVAIDYINDNYTGDDCTIESEVRVFPEHFIGHSDVFGTADIIVSNSEVIEIIDYKDGMSVVSVTDNSQLELYMLGVLSRYKIPINNEYPVKTVKSTIIQPKLTALKMQPITSVVYNINEKGFLYELAKKYNAAVEAAKDINAPLIPGNHCKYCKHKLNCFSNTGATQDNGSTNLAIVSELVNLTANRSEFDKIANLSDERLSEIYSNSSIIKGFLESVEEELKKRLQSGQPVPDYKLVHGRGSRAWSLNNDQLEGKLTKMGVPKDELYVKNIISPAQLEKLVWKKKDGTECKLSERQLKLVDVEYVSHVMGKPTIASVNDSRPAIVNDASLMFKQVSSKEPLPQWLT